VQDPRNLVVVGRCISATHEASAAFRVTPIAMAIGQAGGAVAALASQQNAPAAEVSYEQVRATLIQQGARLPLHEFLTPTNRTPVKKNKKNV
jgi:hypothetical protein